MKSKKLTAIFLTLLATVLLGAGIIMALSQKPVGAGVKWDPKYYTWTDPPPIPPDPWNAQVSLHGGYKAQIDLDPDTVLLEGFYSPSAPTYAAPHGPGLIVPFNGYDVRAALEPYIPYHLGIPIAGKYRIPLQITGETYDGATFQGSGVIVITVPNPNPP